MRSAEGVTEKLKAKNPMEWVRQCNNIIMLYLSAEMQMVFRDMHTAGELVK